MQTKIIGKIIREQRAQKGLTQLQLAELLSVSDKTVSKWETGKGLPDIGSLAALSKALGLSPAQLLAGDASGNSNRMANMLRTNFYVCPTCGNIIQSVGEGYFCCCGNALERAEPQEADEAHPLRVELDSDELYVSVEHEMSKSQYISFFAYVTGDGVQTVKQYPEQNAQTYFKRRGHGKILAYCIEHGLFFVKI